jgi:serine protease
MFMIRKPWVRFVQPFLLVALIGVAAWILTGGVFAQGPGRQGGHDRVNGRDAAAGEVLVKYRTAKSAEERAQAHAVIDADRDEQVGSDDRVRLIHSRRFDAATLVAYFRGAPDVEYAEPNDILYAISTTPNDTHFGQLYGLLNLGQVIQGQTGIVDADIDADDAWDVSTGSTANVVGVVDTGVNYNHPDLAANIWSAPAQFTVTIGGTNTTCAAGTKGFRSINGVKSCDPNDDHSHGSHVSGTIGAVGNNGLGVAGVNWTARIMGLKFLNSAGSGTTADAVNVIEFAIQTKAIFGALANVRILSNSWGGGGFNQTLYNEIVKANQNAMLFVAAAGNNGTNNDASPFYPAGYNVDNVVTVAATDNRDAKAGFSNYGLTSVDLGAPGVNVLSTVLGTSYSYFSGTSMATPHVSGAAALVLSECNLDTAALKANLLGSVDPIASMSGITVTGGRLNVNNALTACMGGDPPPPPIAPAAPTNLLASSGPGRKKITLTWTASSGATSYKVYRSTTSGSGYQLAASGVTSAPYADTGLTSKTTYYYVVTAVNAGGESANSNQASARTQ